MNNLRFVRMCKISQEPTTVMTFILLVQYKFVQRQERDVHISLNWIMTSRNVVNELSTLKSVDLSTEKNLAALNFGRLYVTTSIKT
jgi:hypothetical protein